MPNHLHVLLVFRNTQGKSINSIVGNGKRFMAYDIISKLKRNNQQDLLNQLSSFVNVTEKTRGKLHEVFEPSFDWKECTTNKFIEQKVDYIHLNPCRGNWHLVEQPWEYIHSSAKYYYVHEQGVYEVTDYNSCAAESP